MAEFLKVLDDCGRGNASEVAQVFDELRSSGIVLAAEESLLDHRLGQLGGATLFSGTTLPKGEAEIVRRKDRYEGWVQADAAAAKLWLDELSPGRYRDEMSLAYISASAAADPAGALGEAAALPEMLKGQAGRAVAEHLVQTGSMEEISTLLSGLEAGSDGTNERYLGGIFEGLLNGAVKNGVDPASLVEQHFDQPYVDYSALVKVSVEKAKADPVAALEWAANLEGKKEGVPDGGVLAAALGGMSLGDLDQVEEWVHANAGRTGVDSLLPYLDRQREALDGKGEDLGYDRDD